MSTLPIACTLSPAALKARREDPFANGITIASAANPARQLCRDVNGKNDFKHRFLADPLFFPCGSPNPRGSREVLDRQRGLDEQLRRA